MESCCESEYTRLSLHRGAQHVTPWLTWPADSVGADCIILSSLTHKIRVSALYAEKFVIILDLTVVGLHLFDGPNVLYIYFAIRYYNVIYCAQ